MSNQIFTEYRSKFIYAGLLGVLYFYGPRLALVICAWALLMTIVGRFREFDRGFLILIHGLVTFCVHSTAYDAITSDTYIRIYADQIFLIYMFSVFVVDTCTNYRTRYGLSMVIWAVGCLLHPSVLCDHIDFQHSVWSYGVATTLASFIAGCTPLMANMRLVDVCTQLAWLFLPDWYGIISYERRHYQIWIFALFVFHMGSLYVKNQLYEKKKDGLPVHIEKSQ